MRRLVKPVLSVVALSVAVLPAVLVLALGWYHTPVLGDPMGPGSGVLIVTVLFYVLWLPSTFFGLIWLFDRLGLHYAVEPRKPRTSRKERRRQRAGLELLAAQERGLEQARRERVRQEQAQKERALQQAQQERASKEARQERDLEQVRRKRAVEHASREQTGPERARTVEQARQEKERASGQARQPSRHTRRGAADPEEHRHDREEGP
jgi:hypothetical protein